MFSGLDTRGRSEVRTGVASFAKLESVNSLLIQTNRLVFSMQNGIKYFNIAVIILHVFELQL